MDEYDGFYDYAYDDGWYDVMTGAFNFYRYAKEAGYADGVDDADYHLRKKYQMIKDANAYWS